MTTITKERIELFVKSPLENGLTRGEQMELARIALASLEAEPVGEVSEKRHGLVMDGTVDLGGKSTYRIIKGEKAMKRLPLGTKFYIAPPAPVVDADPVVFTDERNLHHIARGRETSLIWGKQNQEVGDIPLYRHAQPAPVVPEEIPKGLAGQIVSLLAHNIGDKFLAQKIWNACRAALLQGSQPVSNCDELQVIGWLRSDYNSDDKRDHNAPLFMLGSNDPSEAWGVKYIPLSGNSPVIPDGWVMVPKVVTAEIGNAINEVGQRCTCGNCSQRLWDLLLAAAPKPQNAPQNIPENIPAGKSTLTPDGWISCSERMPNSKTGVLVAREFGRKGDWRMKWATYIPWHPDTNDGWLIPGASWKPSHWMPLPEPPQEEK